MTALPERLHDALTIATDKRYVLLGSCGRAAMIGSRQSDELAKQPKDVDLIDRSGQYVRRYHTPLFETLDFMLTGSMRPADTDGNWGLFNDIIPDAEEPVTMFSEELLNMQTVEIEDVGYVTTPDAAAHLSLAFFQYRQAKVTKHPEQLAMLQSITSPRKELEAALEDYHRRMSEYIAMSSLYRRARNKIFEKAPNLASSVSDSVVGTAIRKVRKTDVTNYPLFPSFGA